MYSKTHNINERSTSVPIKIPSPTNMKGELHEYGLKQNFFDPSKSSPPNEFLLKLQNRMNHYSSATAYKNVARRDSE
jgi:hypothetical protein